MKVSLTLIQILEAAPPWPAGQDRQIVTLDYTTPGGWQHTTRVEIERCKDKSLVLSCPWCGEHCTALYADPDGRGIRCERHGRHPPMVSEDDHTKQRRKTAKKAA